LQGDGINFGVNQHRGIVPAQSSGPEQAAATLNALAGIVEFKIAQAMPQNIRNQPIKETP